MKWSTWGAKPQNPAPSWTGLVLAFFFAAQTFVDNSTGYPAFMTWLGVGASLAMLLLGLRKGSWLAGFYLLTAALFLSQALGWLDFSGDLFAMFASHALLAVLLAIASYTFLASEKKSR